MCLTFGLVNHLNEHNCMNIYRYVPANTFLFLSSNTMEALFRTTCVFRRQEKKIFYERSGSASTCATHATTAWDESGHDWKVYPGKYAVEVGASSRDIRYKGAFTIGK